MNSDIVARLRAWRELHLTRLGALFDEAADEICDLRAKIPVVALKRDAEVRQLQAATLTDAEREAVSPASTGSVAGGLRNGALSGCETVPDADSRVGETHPPVCHVPLQKNLTLTDAEREAVECAANEADAHCHRERAATLRGLLERLK